MNQPDPKRATALKSVIEDFVMERRDDKLEKLEKQLEKLEPDDPTRIEEREQLFEQFIPAVWLEDAARRVKQIQAVTHSLKPVHPDAKGTNLYCLPSALFATDVVGSHCLGDNFSGDVVGNAAALDVHKFLKQTFGGRTLLDLSLAADVDLAIALSDDPAKAQIWMQAFASLIEPRGRVASHTLAKQLYWQISDDPFGDAGFHILAPLYASSLAHRVFETLQDDRFSDAAKAAREAKKTNTFSERPVREYPQLAVQQLGGTKPQNISQLNSERRGNNSLLASLPPAWRSVDLTPLHNTNSMFHRYSRRPSVRQNVNALRNFLKAEPKGNMETRDKRAAWVHFLIDDFLQFTAELRSLEPGWSQSSACQLGEAESRWLDPDGMAQIDAELSRSPITDVSEQISASFANWLNAQLRDQLPAGDPEFLTWRNAMQEEIKAGEREGNHVK
jgi:CRISPR-associated protein Csy1